METVTITLRVRKEIAEKIRREARRRYGNRRGSIRKYIEDLVEKDSIEELIDLVRQASAKIGPISRDEMHERN